MFNALGSFIQERAGSLVSKKVGAAVAASTLAAGGAPVDPVRMTRAGSTGTALSPSTCGTGTAPVLLTHGTSTPHPPG